MQTQIAGIGETPVWAKVLLLVPANDMGREGEAAIGRNNSNDRFAAFLGAIAQEQDRQAFQNLFAHFAPRVKAYLLGLKLTPESADDLVQDVFVTIWRKAHLYDAERAFVSTWIFTIARNRFIDERRKESRFPADELVFQEEGREAETGESILAERQTAMHVRRALKTLSSEQQDVIRKSFLEGKSHGEVARETGLPLGTVKSRIRLAFQKMRKELEKTQ